MSKIISANRLSDGIVVYFEGAGSWRENIDLGQILASEAEVEAALGAARIDAKRNLIVDPFAVEVASGDNGLNALSLRDAIRARGPTIDFTPHAGPRTARTERS